MAIVLWLPLLCAISSGSASAQSSSSPRAKDVSLSLDKWRRAYVSGYLELDEPLSTRRSAYGRLTPEVPEFATHYDGLIGLLDHTSGLEAKSIRCFVALLRLAAVGRSGPVVHPTRGAEVIRAAARAALGRATDRRLQFAIVDAAAGRPSTWEGDWDPHLQAAAVRSLGILELSVTRPTIERACESEDAPVRLAAAFALHAMGPTRSLEPICDAMERERDGRVAERLASAAHAILSRHVDECDTKLVRRAVHSALTMLGKTGDWRADLAVVELCEAFRNRSAVEPLIEILERFETDPEGIDKGRISGVLRKRTHDALQTLTGARIPADSPADWRAFWDRVHPEFVLANQPERDEGQTFAGFFGIPIAGTRVVFVIDRSGSMREPFGNGGTRHEQARTELLQAAAALPSDARFKVITFGDRAKPWRHDFSSPNEANFRALRDTLRRRGAKGATDLYGGLARALEIEAAKFGERYPSPVDEIFLLSDGAPSAGEIVSPSRILSAVREANEHRQVRIHTVFIGNSASAADFMQTLATENHGQFVRR